LLGKFPDEELKPGDECFSSTGKWDQSYKATIGERQSYGIWYRRRNEPVEPKFAVGQMVRVVGPKVKPATHWTAAMDEHIEQVYTVVSAQSYPRHPSGATNFYSVKGVVEWAFREDYLEAVEPEAAIALPIAPKHLIAMKGDVVQHLNGLTLRATEKGFEVTQ
jgi:hypothetical protein